MGKFSVLKFFLKYSELKNENSGHLPRSPVDASGIEPDGGENRAEQSGDQLREELRRNPHADRFGTQGHL